MLNYLNPIKKLSKAIKRKDIDQKFLFNQYLNKMESKKNSLNSWRIYSKEYRNKKNLNRSELPLAGLLVGIKDNISTSEFDTKMGTEYWEGTPGGFDSRVAFKLKYFGALVVGKNICSEFAVHKVTGTINPRYPDCEPGTSSSGSAAAVASGEISLSIATQTAGSIAKPASYCGCIGFKPSFGDIPRTGILKTTELFDSVGFIGARVEDIDLVYELSKVSGKDYPLHEANRRRFDQAKFDSVILLSGNSIDSLTEKLSGNLNTFSNLIAGYLACENVKYISVDWQQLRNAFLNIYHKDLETFLSYHVERNKMSLELQEIIESGKKVNEKMYNDSKLVIMNWKEKIINLTNNPLFISLASSTSAPKIGDKDYIDANLFLTAAGMPQVVIPCFSDNNGKIINVSLSSQRYSDRMLLDLTKKIFPLEIYSIPNFNNPNSILIDYFNLN